LVGREVSNPASSENEDSHDEEVPGSDSEDLSPNGSRKDCSILADGTTAFLSAFDDSSTWRLSSKSDGSEGVHDQVDPEELDG